MSEADKRTIKQSFYEELGKIEDMLKKTDKLGLNNIPRWYIYHTYLLVTNLNLLRLSATTNAITEEERALLALLDETTTKGDENK